MRHATDGVLRRLHDEPFAVPDTTFDHVARCRRCSARRDDIAAAAGLAGRLLSPRRAAPDVDLSWAEFRGRLQDQGGATRVGVPALRSFSPARRLTRLSARGAAIAGGAAVAMAGTAAAATYTTIFAPTHVAPVPVTAGDLSAISGLMSLGDTGSPAGFPTASGAGTLPFGTLRWSSSGPARQVGSLGEAQTLSGVRVALPARLPSGVGAPDRYVVQPKVTATVTFNSAAGTLDGKTVMVSAGPAVFVGYGSRTETVGVPTLAVLAMPRPVATSAGASLSQVESFLLSRPGIPPELATEIRLLGDGSAVLPIPTVAGVRSQSVQVGRWPGVLMSAPSGVASGVVWEDGNGTVHLVAGLVNQRGVIDVANQIG